MNIVIEIQNQTKTKVPARRFFISAAQETLRLTTCLAGDGKSRRTNDVQHIKIEISLVFVSSRRIQQLNKKYRGKNAPTDVLSFPCFSPPAKRLLRATPAWRVGKIVAALDPDGMVRIGEIVIAPAVAKHEAALYRHAVRQHYAFLFTHGLLHLLGYDHETSRKDEIEMQKVQQYVIRWCKGGFRS